MEKFVPYEKLSKKKRRELDLMKRGSWGGLNPVTRKPANPKAYNRKKAQSWKNDSGSALYSNRSRFAGLRSVLASHDPCFLLQGFSHRSSQR